MDIGSGFPGVGEGLDWLWSASGSSKMGVSGNVASCEWSREKSEGSDESITPI
jgi:hypothetical protein